MRLTPTKILNAFTAVVLFVLLWTVFSGTTFNGNDASRRVGHTCVLPEAYVSSLHDLVYRVHKTLDGLDLTHFLCYGSLFGQVRRSASLPWEKDAEFCVLNEEFSRYDENFLRKSFLASNGLEISYDSAEGIYVVTKADFDGYVQLVVFADDKGVKTKDGDEKMLHRVGWKRRLLPSDCDIRQLECFPARLAASPLPLKLFGTEAVPVPREEFEILKFHFPDNWWREEKPINC